MLRTTRARVDAAPYSAWRQSAGKKKEPAPKNDAKAHFVTFFSNISNKNIKKMPFSYIFDNFYLHFDIFSAILYQTLKKGIPQTKRKDFKHEKKSHYK
jgi:hypothetical protein